MHVIGLTGGLGTGKSTVASLFADLGAKVIDADKITHQLMRPGRKCFQPVVRLLGKDILKAGRIDRKKVADRVFKDTQLLKKLEQIIHPNVRNEIAEHVQKYLKMKKNVVIVIEVPLLFETGFDTLMTTTVVVRADRDTQIKRARNKLNLSDEEVKRRIKEQMPLGQKSRLADVTIDNNENLTHTKKQVKKLWQKLQ